MNEREFDRLMMVYGGEIGRWPSHRQCAAEKWLLAHPKARSALRRAAEMDRLLQSAAPSIAFERTERAIDALLRETARVPQVRRRWRFPLPEFALPQWRWPPKSAIYLGLFFLGCAANIAVRLMVADSPLDLWFSGNLSLPLGG
jgi:anti-sigma factor RsiW